MKYYESNFDEYIQSVNQYNIHPELESVIDSLPKSINDFCNIILYGPSGVGKYSQALKIIQKYSPSKLKYDKKMGITNEKQEKKKTKTEPKRKSKDTHKPLAMTKTTDYLIRISDIHYEVDMSLLGCNSKALWYDIFFQVVDIVSLKSDKAGIIVCKNFHCVYNELLDVFYSYMKHPLQNIKLKFILITEHTGFISNNIFNSCMCIRVKRPENKYYLEMYKSKVNGQTVNNCMKDLDTSTIINAKEIYQCKHLKLTDQLPTDVFNIINNNIIKEMLNPQKLQLAVLRNNLYDLLVYNIDVAESICYILFYFIENNAFKNEQLLSQTIKQTFTFLKYFNNNYRSIYHIESIIVFIICKIHCFENT
uniref:Uncharacterized protein n=1 Tax=viral metagenome TaxID=1070528 RepID=A0A6C0HIE8_9ZZZZ